LQENGDRQKAQNAIRLPLNEREVVAAEPPHQQLHEALGEKNVLGTDSATQRGEHESDRIISH